MSKYATAETEFKDKALLVKALQDIGYPCEVFETPQHLVGIGGRVRPETAEIIIRREHVGRASNEIGFTLNPQTGKYSATISQFDDQANFTPARMLALKCAYRDAGIMRQATRQGLRFTGTTKNAKGEKQMCFVKVGA